MSWSFYAIGTAEGIEKKMREESEKSGMSENGKQMTRNCTVRIEPFNHMILD